MNSQKLNCMVKFLNVKQTSGFTQNMDFIKAIQKKTTKEFTINHNFDRMLSHTYCTRNIQF